MSGVLIVSGTDTGIGKTLIAAGIAEALGAYYWKPIQAGTDEVTDSETAIALGLPQERVLPEAYRLAMPASPHRAAMEDGVSIDPQRLRLPTDRPLIVEGAGGLMVPLALDPPRLMIDQFADWRAPVLLVARTGLGTINHSLLSIAALRERQIPIAGIVFSGEDEPATITAIARLGNIPTLGRLPRLASADAGSLARAIAGHIDLDALRGVMAIVGQGEQP